MRRDLRDSILCLRVSSRWRRGPSASPGGPTSLSASGRSTSVTNNFLATFPNAVGRRTVEGTAHDPAC